jgi:hypothetical protein
VSRFSLIFAALPRRSRQVVELRAPDSPRVTDLDLVDDRRVHREGPLDAHAEAHLADGEGLTGAGTLTTDSPRPGTPGCGSGCPRRRGRGPSSVSPARKLGCPSGAWRRRERPACS